MTFSKFLKNVGYILLCKGRNMGHIHILYSAPARAVFALRDEKRSDEL